ncbi:MAG TPA: hypothetical protein VK515_00395 [Rhizomicrobium sp.]|jgi:hypothetical protein|nr:hypothetical protein [Rhizomicrobium sp.]
MAPIRLTALSGLFLLLLAAPAFAEELAPTALNSLSTMPAKAASAKVMDQNGHLLGQVERIQADQDGKPSALAFRAANSGKTVVISAAAASYDGNVVVVDNDQPQVTALIQPQRTATN